MRSSGDMELIWDEIIFRSVTGDHGDKLTEVQGLVLRSALKRGDLRKATQLMLDWGHEKKSWVTRWLPGDHFYAQGKKFNRYQDAEDYLKEIGFASLGLKEVEIPRTRKEGD